MTINPLNSNLTRPTQNSFSKRHRLLPVAALLQGLFLMSHAAHAASTIPVANEAEFRNAITSAQIGDQIVITANFALTQPLPAPTTSTGITITSGGGVITGGALFTGGNTFFLLRGANTYAGGTVINGGDTIDIAADNNIGNPSGSVSLQSGGMLRFQNAVTTNRQINLQAGGVLDARAGDSIVSGLVSGSGGLTIRGTSGSVELTNIGNNYTGPTTVDSNAKLIVTNDGQLGNLGDINLNAGSTLELQGTGFSSNRIVMLNGASTVLVNSAFAAGTIAGPIGGTGDLTKTGDGILTLSGNNDYVGTTNIAGGVLAVTGDGSLGAAGSGLTFSNGATLDTGTSNFGSDRSIVLSGGASGGGRLMSNQAMTLRGNISGTGHLTIAGGLVTLSGNNSYSGGTLVSGGSLLGTTDSLQGNITNNSNVTFDQGSAGSYSGVISGSGTLTKDGPGTVTLSGSNTYTGGTVIKGGNFAVFNDANLGAANGALTFDGGGLESRGAFTLASTRPVHVNAGGAVIRSTSDLTIGSVIDGVGGVMKIGGGKLVLTGNNTYTGGTVIAQGTLEVTSDTNLGASTGKIKFNGGALSVSGAGFASNRPVTLLGGGVVDTAGPGTFLTLNGPIDGSGTLTKTGAGGLVLTGTNSNTGNIVVAAGLLRGNTDSLKGNILNNGDALEFQQSADGTFLGAISGTGDVDKTGNGTLILKGANTFTGAMHVLGGTLQGDSGSLRGNITNDASLVFDQVADGTFAGNITGTGGVTKIGAGVLTMSGGGSYDGPTAINRGTLHVTGSISPTSALSVANGATLSGTGSVGTINVASGGTVAGGGAGSIGSLTINGDYIPAAGSKLRALFDGASASKLVVTGAVPNIENAAVQMRAANGAPVVQGGYTLNKQYTLLTSTGGITGSLPAVDSDLTFLTFTPSFQNANKDLAVTISAIAAAPPSGPVAPLTTAFSQHATNESQRAAAAALDSHLTSLPAQAALATAGVTPSYALQSLSGYQYGVANQVTQSRLQQLQQNINQQQQCQAIGGASLASGVSAGTECQSVWIEAGGDHFRLQDDSGSPGVTSSGDHLAVGVQRNFGDGWSGGMMLGRSNSSTDFGNMLGDGRVRSTQVGVYARWSGDGQYVNASLVGGHDKYAMHRDIRGNGARASAEYDGSSVGANVEAGMTWGSLGSVSMQPFIGLGVTDVRRDAVREVGAGELDLQVGGQHDTAVTGQIGMRFTGSLGVSSGSWYLQPAWKHFFVSASSRVDASFASDGAVAFTYDGAKPKRDAVALEAGVQGEIAKGFTWYTGASVQSGNRADALRISGGLKAKW